MNRLDFAQLFAALPSPHMILDPELRFVAANPAYEAATGRLERELVGQSVFAAFPNEGPEGRRLRESLASVFATGRPDTLAYIHYRIPRPDALGGGFDERFWSAVHTPLFDKDGEVIFVLQNTVDITELVQLRAAAAIPFDALPAEMALVQRAREAESAYTASMSGGADFRRLFQQSPSMVSVMQGPTHIFTFANDTISRFLGGREIVGLPARVAFPELARGKLFEAMDAAYASGEPQYFEGLKLPMRIAAGSVDVHLDLSIHPIRDVGGEIRGIFCQATDRTEAVKAGERQRMLLDELNHRVKNTLSAVQSIARQSLFGNKPVDLARQTFESRIRALSVAHDVLSERHWESVDLATIVHQELSMFDADKVTVRGPEIRLDPKSAIAMALVFHELGSNAGKYGALAQPDGHVMVEWRQGDDGRTQIRWQERQAHGPAEPPAPGFGIRMLRRIVEGELDGRLALAFSADGVICTMDIELACSAERLAVGSDI